MADLLSREFCDSTEPMAGIFSRDEFNELLDFTLLHDLDEELSVVATYDEKVIGAIHSHELDMSLELPENMKDFLEESYATSVIMDCLEILEEEYVKYCSEKGYEKVIHGFLGAIDSGHYGNKVLENMIHLTCDNGREKGFQSFYVECTNLFSQRPILKLGGQFVGEVKYKEYEYTDGKKVYEFAKEKMIAKLKEDGLFKEELEDLYCEGCVGLEIPL